MFDYTVYDQRLIQRLNANPPRVMEGLRQKLDALDIALQSRIMAKLNGPVLQHRRGWLSGSIRFLEAVIFGNTVTGSVEGAGGRAWYGRLHEYGGSFVAARKLRRPPHMVTRAGGERVMTGSPYGLHFQEKSFMRSSYDEMREMIFRGMGQALAEGVNG